ncbi:MAG TPA: DegT/DnrJ/EryC1/StrS family aminotransferase [Polyangiaceae bacterium]|nr:DegT/DnrJ/EryC1/StrS family aminotransferase [Polyangiaceae bacterium]
MPIPLFDPQRQYAPLMDALGAAAARVLAAGRYVLGPEVAAFEQEVAGALGVEHAVGVSSGSDALVVALLALGVGAGDEVITSPYSFVATSESIRRVGARPVFVDVRADTYDLDAVAVEPAITDKTRAVIGVHLFGQPCDAWRLRALCDARGIAFIEDAAQAFGAARVHPATGSPAPSDAAPVGAIGHAAGFSFFPAKVFGGFGDAGLVTTNDAEVADRARALRQHGMQDGEARRLGGNYRLDALQAALLRVVLPGVEQNIARRRAVAARYDAAFCDLPGVRVPALRPDMRHVYAAYALAVPAPARDPLLGHLAECGIESAVYYRAPLHLQPANADLGYGLGAFPVAERLCTQLLALPIHPALTDHEVARVIDEVRRAAG